MADPDMGPVPLPTERGGEHAHAGSTTAQVEHASYLESASGAIASSAKQTQNLEADKNAAVPTPSPQNPDGEAEQHATAESDDYNPQTLDVGCNKAWSFINALVTIC